MLPFQDAVEWARWRMLGPRYADTTVRQDRRTFQALFPVPSNGLRAVPPLAKKPYLPNRAEIRYRYIRGPESQIALVARQGYQSQRTLVTCHRLLSANDALI